MSDITRNRNVYTPVQEAAPPHMAHKPRKTRRWLYVVAGICAAVAICGTWGVVLNAIAPIPQQDNTAAVATGLPALEEDAAAWQGELHTNTPKPSRTANPSRTPFPTYTPLPTDTPAPNVVYVDREVTREVDRVITATPEPVTKTAQPVPSDTPTPDAIATQAAFDQAIVNSQTRRNDVIMWAIVVLIILILILLLLNAYINTVKSWVPKIKLPKPARLEDNRTTRDELETAHDEKVSDIIELLDVSIRNYGPAAKKLAGHRLVDGWTGEKWQQVIDDMRAAGMSIIAQQGIGTTFLRLSLRGWKLRFENGGAIPYPTDKPNN